MTTLLLAALDAYRALARPFLPPSCRFHPSCGDYAAEAVASRGALPGTILTLRRLLRCHPLTDGGYDPVPQPHHG
jgi:putative membrane protein insertion efficiency factor